MKKLINYKDKKPLVHETVFLAEGANIIGDVKIDENTSVWFNTVIRGDVKYIKIGKMTLKILSKHLKKQLITTLILCIQNRQKKKKKLFRDGS